MIFEALLLLPRADNRPGNRYVLWRRLRLAPFFILEVNMIELHIIGGKYEVYQRNEFIGTLETYSNPHHLTNCYIKLNLIKLDSSISMELFTRLRAVVGKPIQAMLDSTEISQIEFLTAAGFTCKRKCYKVEATAHDFISDNEDMRISECIVGDPVQQSDLHRLRR